MMGKRFLAEKQASLRKGEVADSDEANFTRFSPTLASTCLTVSRAPEADGKRVSPGSEGSDNPPKWGGKSHASSHLSPQPPAGTAAKLISKERQKKD